MSSDRKRMRRGTQAILSLISNILVFTAAVPCLLFLFLGTYAVIDTIHLYTDAEDSSVLKFLPDTEEQAETMYEELKGSVSWLYIEDTGIDDPVMQGNDNMEYLNRNPYGEFSLSGSLFLDSRNSPDFSDPYSLIYGHHMEYGMMFGALDSFLDEHFFLTHTSGTLYIRDRVCPLEIFAVAECQATDAIVFTPGEGEGLEEYIRTHSLHYRQCPGGRILGMSTCKYPQTDERTIVYAYIRDEERNSR